jgi:hypothetical protein
MLKHKAEVRPKRRARAGGKSRSQIPCHLGRPSWWGKVPPAPQLLVADDEITPGIRTAAASLLGVSPATITVVHVNRLLRSIADWQQEQAMWEAANVSPVPPAPSLPSGIEPLDTEHELEALEQKFNEGDRRALLQATFICLREGLSLSRSRWPARALMEVFWRAKNGEVDCWNQEFGRPKGGKHLARGNRDLQVRLVWKEIKRRQRARQPLDFEAIGRAVGVGSAAKVKRLYVIARLWHANTR